MNAYLLTEGQTLAAELRAVLQALDPARWKSEMEEGIRSRLDELARRLRQLPDSGPPAVRRNLAELGQTIEGSVPRAPMEIPSPAL